MKRAPVAMLLFLSLAGSALAQTTLDRAHEAFRQGQWQRAAQLFTQAAEETPEPRSRAEIRVKLAWTYFFALKNRSRAEQSLRQALQENPDLEIIPDLYTDDFVALFARVKAQVAASPGPSPTPRPTAPVTSLAALRARLATAVDAIALEALLQEARAAEVGQSPAALPDLLELEADILDRLGRPQEALRYRGRAQALRTVAQAAPGTTVVPLEMIRQARQHLVAGQPQDAIALLQGVLDALPACIPAFEVLAQAYLDAGLFDEAYSALQTALMGNEKPELLLALGELELARRRPNAARDAFRRAVTLDPSNDRALAALGLLVASLEDYPSAKEYLDQALKANGTLFQARVTRAQLALLEGSPQEAVTHLLRALQVRPQDPWATGWLGVAYLALGDVAAAETRLRSATQGGAQEFTLFWAEAMLRQGQAAKVLTMLAADDPNPHAQLLRAHALLATGRTSEALELLERLVKLYPTKGEVRYLLGYAQFALRQWAQAWETLKIAQELRGAPQHVSQAVSSAAKASQAQQLMDSALVPPPLPPRR
ncbi:MAG: tetratricopeptide repeat protein [Thermoanaerobaculum sp.]|nr:tetratricopeptide repeat protein [Thermoanaerobaculum sp.]MDW7966629.1 tetratricopeptide repeat protein [Thermoanaerobaculum sp.]